MVSSGVVGSRMIFWKRRSSAPSFSMYSRYSSRVVAPMHWSSPRARAGLKRLEASMLPGELPAPTMVCSSSMKRMTLGFFSSSVRMVLTRSSNWPRYLVPATREAMSRATTRLFMRVRDTWPCTMFMARPSATADLPTPGSPMSTGLFFLRRLRIWAMRSSSFWRPTTGSSLPSAANLVRSLPKLSSMGVAEPLALSLAARAENRRSSSSSISSSGATKDSVLPAPMFNSFFTSAENEAYDSPARVRYIFTALEASLRPSRSTASIK